MSQRDAIDFSLSAAELDMEAVIDRLGLASFSIFSLSPRFGPLPFAYAARHPERVSSLVHHAGSEHSRFRKGNDG